MIRLLFVLFVTLGGFAAAALWNARDRGPQDASERLESPEPSAAVAAEVDRLGLPEAGARLRAAAAKAAAAISERSHLRESAVEDPIHSESDAGPRHVREAQAAEEPPTPALPSVPAPEAESRPIADGGAGGALTPDDMDGGDDAEREVEEGVLTPPLEFARDLGSAPDAIVENGAALLPEDGGTDAPDWEEDTPTHDSDRSARLIRRMLAVYRSTGAKR